MIIKSQRPTPLECIRENYCGSCIFLQDCIQFHLNNPQYDIKDELKKIKENLFAKEILK